MSAPLSKDMIFFRQRILACAGLYKGDIDGRWGTMTTKADEAFEEEFQRIRSTGGKFDPRTENNIRSLLPKAQVKAREFMRLAGTNCQIISGTRTYPEQNVLFAQKKPKVTNARGGQSNHNFGIAWDIGLFQNGEYLNGDTPQEQAAYVALGKKIKSSMKGLEWGGDWKFVDRPHYQLATGRALSQIRTAFEAGRPFV